MWLNVVWTQADCCVLWSCFMVAIGPDIVITTSTTKMEALPTVGGAAIYKVKTLWGPCCCPLKSGLLHSVSLRGGQG